MLTECVDTIKKLKDLTLDDIGELRKLTPDTLRKLTPDTAPCVTVQGYYKPGDGGGGSFFWDVSFKVNLVKYKEGEDFGTIIKPTWIDPKKEGRWRRIYDQTLSVKWFGARGDMKGTEGHNKGHIGKSSFELNAYQPIFTDDDEGKAIVIWNVQTIAKTKPFISTIVSFKNPQKVVLKHAPVDEMKNASIAWGTDDTLRIQEAIDVAKESGLAVYLPPGHFLITESLRYFTSQSKDATERDENYSPASPYPSMIHGLLMFGAGVQVSFLHNQIRKGDEENGSPAIRIDGAAEFTNGGYKEMHPSWQQTGLLKDFDITSTGHIENTTGIDIRSTWFYSVQNVRIMGMASHGIIIRNRYFAGGTSDFDQTDQLHLDNVFAFRNGGWGIIVDAIDKGLSTSKIHIERCRMEENGCGGIQWTGQGGTIERCGIYGNGVDRGIMGSPSKPPIPPKPRDKAYGILTKNVKGTSNGLLITGCEIQGNADVQVMIEVGANIRIVQNDFKDDDQGEVYWPGWTFPSVDIQVGDGNIGDGGGARSSRTVTACVIEDNRIRANYGRGWGKSFLPTIPPHTVVKVNTNAVGTIIGKWWTAAYDVMPGWRLVDLVEIDPYTHKRATFPFIGGHSHIKTHLHRDGHEYDGGHVLLPFASRRFLIDDEIPEGKRDKLLYDRAIGSGIILVDNVKHQATFIPDTSQWSNYYLEIGGTFQSLVLANPTVRSVGAPLFFEFKNNHPNTITLTFGTNEATSEYVAGKGITLWPDEIVSGIILFDETGKWRLYTPWVCDGAVLSGSIPKSRIL